MSNFEEFNGKKPSISELEEIVTDYLVNCNSPLISDYHIIELYSNQFFVLGKFYVATIFLVSDKIIQVGQRVKFIELNSRTLQQTGNVCYRFIKSRIVLPTLLLDEYHYELECSVQPIGSEPLGLSRDRS